MSRLSAEHVHLNLTKYKPQRAHPPLPTQEDRLRRPVGRGPAGHRRRDQRHPHEGPGPGNVQRGLAPRTRQGALEDKSLKDERCTYKLNSGIKKTTFFNALLKTQYAMGLRI